MIKILIPNATGPTNVGDQAILTGLLKALNKIYRDPTVIIHSSENKKYKNLPFSKVKQTLYSWSILDSKNPIEKIYKLYLLLLNYILIKLNISQVGPKVLIDILDDYKKADVIIFAGGGYLRSQKGFKQSLNLLMLISMFKFANLVKSKKILAPSSFGPFAYSWQEELTAKTLLNLDTVFAREIYSYNALKKSGLKPVLTTDPALFISRKKHIRKKSFILGFTIRNWLEYNQQFYFEEYVADAVFNFYRKFKISIQPIIHVDAPKYGDFDRAVTERIIKNLKSKGVSTLKAKEISSLKNGLKTYSNLDMLLGMRMHSNIMAALVGVPFVAIAYEYKTEGICKALGVEKYVVNVKDFEKKKLSPLLNDLYMNHTKVSEIIKSNLIRIQKEQIDVIRRNVSI